MAVNKNKLETGLLMLEALSQLNLDEEGFRYKFSIEDHIEYNWRTTKVISS